MPKFEKTYDLNIEFEVYCARCGAGLCANATTGETPRRGMSFVRVEPCESCLSKEREAGREEGHEQATEETQQAG